MSIPAGLASAGIARSATQPIALRIAVLEPRTGDFSKQTQAMANGLEVGVAAVNRTAGKTGVRLQLDRTRFVPGSKPATLVAAAARRGATVIVLPCHPDLQTSIAGAAARQKLLILAPCDSDPRAAQRVARYWTVGMTGNAEAAQLVNFAALQNGTSGLIVSSPGSRYSMTFAKYVRVAAKRRTVSIVGQKSMRLNSSDIAGVVAEINRTKPRVLFAGLYSPYSEQFVAKLRAAGVRIPVYLPSGADTRLDISRFGDVMKDVTFGSFGFPRPSAESLFLDPFRKRFKRPVYGSYPGIGFETARVAATAARGARATTGDALDRAFRKGLRTVGVAAGDLAYTAANGRHPSAEVGLARIIRGEYVAVTASIPLPEFVPPA